MLNPLSVEFTCTLAKQSGKTYRKWQTAAEFMTIVTFTVMAQGDTYDRNDHDKQNL